MFVSNDAQSLEILVVDDDKVVTLLHKNLLRNSGLNWPPVICENGLEAFKYIEKNDGDRKHFLIFLDLNMPVLNGWKFLKKLKKLELLSHVNVVIVTSSINQKDYLKAQKYESVLYYCKKPMRLECVEKIMDHEVLKPFFTDVTAN
ncbi:MAG: response regulator [Salinimicrobium sediminis]|nr:response regulator [Salinimicrobium sediminis]